VYSVCLEKSNLQSKNHMKSQKSKLSFEQGTMDKDKTNEKDLESQFHVNCAQNFQHYCINMYIIVHKLGQIYL
jgi:hypothetical protein